MLQIRRRVGGGMMASGIAEGLMLRASGEVVRGGGKGEDVGRMFLRLWRRDWGAFAEGEGEGEGEGEEGVEVSSEEFGKESGSEEEDGGGVDSFCRDLDFCCRGGENVSAGGDNLGDFCRGCVIFRFRHEAADFEVGAGIIFFFFFFFFGIKIELILGEIFLMSIDVYQ